MSAKSAGAVIKSWSQREPSRGGRVATSQESEEERRSRRRWRRQEDKRTSSSCPDQNQIPAAHCKVSVREESLPGAS